MYLFTNILWIIFILVEFKFKFKIGYYLDEDKDWALDVNELQMLVNFKLILREKRLLMFLYLQSLWQGQRRLYT